MPSFESSNQGKQCQSPLDLNRMAQVIEQLSPTDKARPCTVHDPAGLVHRTNIDRMILRIPPQESPKEPISFSQLISVPVSVSIFCLEYVSQTYVCIPPALTRRYSISAQASRRRSNSGERYLRCSEINDGQNHSTALRRQIRKRMLGFIFVIMMMMMI